MASRLVRFLSAGVLSLLFSATGSLAATLNFPLPSGSGSGSCEYTSQGCFVLPADFTVLIDDSGRNETVTRQFEFVFSGGGSAIFESTVVPSNGFTGTFQFGEIDPLAGPGDFVFLGATTNLGGGPHILQLLSGVLYGIRVAGTFASGGGNYDIALTAVPIPPALLLFGSALVGLGYLARRRGRSIGPSLPS